MLDSLLADLVAVGVVPTICTWNFAPLVERALSMNNGKDRNANGTLNSTMLQQFLKSNHVDLNLLFSIAATIIMHARADGCDCFNVLNDIPYN